MFSLQNGLNALHLAAKEGHKDLVEELLDRGAPVDSSTKVEKQYILRYRSLNMKKSVESCIVVECYTVTDMEWAVM